MTPGEIADLAAAQYEREKAAHFAHQVGRALVGAADCAFEAVRHAHEIPIAWSLRDAIKRARAAADIAAEYEGRIDKEKMRLTLAAALREAETP